MYGLPMYCAHHHAGRVVWCAPRFTLSPNPPTLISTLVGLKVLRPPTPRSSGALYLVWNLLVCCRSKARSLPGRLAPYGQGSRQHTGDQEAFFCGPRRKSGKFSARAPPIRVSRVSRPGTQAGLAPSWSTAQEHKFATRAPRPSVPSEQSGGLVSS